MSKLRLSLLFISFTLFGTQISKMFVDSKALLCQPPPKWTVNNGSDPMAESSGNVTLVTLINASYRFGLKQASSLENMLRFLKKSGLKDIHFIIINSKDFDAKQQLNQLLVRVSFGVYQEREEELVWNALDGGKDDMFIYDRCGLLTYYIPFPLSIIHAQQPILQAALLSTYFDNPCGETCDSTKSDISSTTTSASTSINASADTTVNYLGTGSLGLNVSSINLTLTQPMTQPFVELRDNELNTSAIDLKDERVFTYDTTETSDLLIGEEVGGSGSGDQPIESFDTLNPEINNTFIEMNNTLDTDIKVKDNKDVEDWKIMEFFKHSDNRSDKEVFDEIYDKSINELETIGQNESRVNETPIEVITTTQMTEIPSVWNDSQTTISPIVETTTAQIRPKISFFKSASRAKCESFNQSMCIEWSTDRLLRARLCCLTEVLADEDSGFGCGHFERSKCNRMLPLIKCCLKDFSQLLENYFQTIPITSRPSRQRFRN